MTQDSGLKSQPSRSAGKGSRPRPVRGSTYRQRYDAIKWNRDVAKFVAELKRTYGKNCLTAPFESKSKSTSKSTSTSRRRRT